MPLNFQAIADQRPQNKIHYFPTTGSTMVEAAHLAVANAPHGTVVIADEQTAGIGRLGRSWISEKDAGIYLSTLLRLPISVAELPVVTLALGLATAEAIEQTTGIDCDLRWPNDVLIDERKVAGILAQLHEGCIVTGIGINVNQTSLPDDLRTPATSLRMAGNQTFSREAVILNLLKCLDDFCSLLVDNGPKSVIRAFTQASSYVVHRRIVYETEQGLKKGMTQGLNESGFLLVRDDLGTIHTLYAGGVRLDRS